jgi:hypothetical protein
MSLFFLFQNRRKWFKRAVNSSKGKVHCNTNEVRREGFYLGITKT